MTRYDERIRAMTVEQRAFLARQLTTPADRVLSESSPQLVAWFVADAQDLDPDMLRRTAEQRLPRAVIPGRMVRVPSIPRTSTGKVDRKQLASTPLAPQPERNDTVRQLSSLESQLLSVFREVLNNPQLTVHDDFFQNGGDSLATIRVIALCGEIGIRVTPGAVHDAPTVAELAGCLSESCQERVQEHTSSEPGTAVDSDETRPGPRHSVRTIPNSDEQKSSATGVRRAMLVPLSNYSDKPPLFLVPAGSVSVSGVRHLAREISEFTCYALVTMEPQATVQLRVEELAQAFVAELRSKQPTGPYRIAGICEGAYICWDIARQLSAEGDDVSFLGLFDTPNPDALSFKPIRDRLRTRIRRLEAPSVFEVVRQIVKRIRSYLLRRSKELITKNRKLTRSGTQMGWHFHPQPFNGQATLFLARKELINSDFTTDATYGWDQLPTGGLDICSLPCTRQQLLSPPYVEVVAKRIELDIRSRESGTRQGRSETNDRSE